MPEKGLVRQHGSRPVRKAREIARSRNQDAPEKVIREIKIDVTQLEVFNNVHLTRVCRSLFSPANPPQNRSLLQPCFSSWAVPNDCSRMQRHACSFIWPITWKQFQPRSLAEYSTPALITPFNRGCLPRCAIVWLVT